MISPLRSVASSLAVVVSVATVVACSSSSSSSGSGGADQAIDVVATCPAVDACGGDPTGMWEYVHGCAEQDAATCSSGGSGTIKGTFQIGNGSYSYDKKTSITACGQVDSGSDGSGGSVVVSGNTMTFGGSGGDAYTFCVKGDMLTLIHAGAKAPELNTIVLRRSVGDGGADGS